ncbi:MAG: xylulokinase [Anaerolineae bacterium]
MTKPYFIGIDVSTTASKALVVDLEGQVIATKSYPHPLSTPRPLWSEQNPLDWWQATSSALRDVMKEVSADDVAAIGLTGQMHGLTSLDGEGNPVRPAILWNDQRSGRQCEVITEKVGAHRLWTLIGSRLLAGFTAPKIMWVRENEPEVYQQIKHVLLPKDYIRFKLSGAYVADVADGSGFGLMDIAKRAWSDELIAAFDIPKAWLPDLCESPEICAHVSEEAAAQTGLRAGTPIVGGAGDQAAAGVGSGIVAMNQVSLTVGTSGVAFASSTVYNPQPEGLLHHFCAAVPGTWHYMGVMLSAAGGLRWFHDELSPTTSYDDLNTQIAAVPRGSYGLIFAPYLTGERNPHPDPLARGAFVGLTLRHGIPSMARAVMEGVAFGMRDQIELLRGVGVNPTEAVIGGGAANSPVWRQMFADIMGMPLYTLNSLEGAALGAAILAAVGVSAYRSVPAAAEQILRREMTIQPDAAGVSDYARLYPIFRAAYPSLKQLYADLATFEM